jgi:hypothetical protein
MLDVTPLMPLNAASADTRELQELAGRPAAIVLHYRNRTCRITLSLSRKHEPSRSKVQSTRRNEIFAASVIALILSNGRQRNDLQMQPGAFASSRLQQNLSSM